MPEICRFLGIVITMYFMCDTRTSAPSSESTDWNCARARCRPAYSDWSWNGQNCIRPNCGKTGRRSPLRVTLSVLLRWFEENGHDLGD